MTGPRSTEPATTQPPGAAADTASRPRTLLRFRRSQSGATAIEFGFVAAPFLMLIAAIVETAMMLWTSQVLEESVSTTARSLLTGQSRTLYPGGNDAAGKAANAEAFKLKVCAEASALVDCSKLKIDVRSYGNFATAKTGTAASNPIKGGALDTSGFGYTAPAAEQIVVVRAVLEYSLFFTDWSSALANIGPGQRAIVASATFRTEPFAGT
jgi:Flp pilus assembly protein TadG